MFYDWQTRLSAFTRFSREDPQKPTEAVSDWAVRIKAKVCDELGLPPEDHVRTWGKLGHPDRACQLLPSTDYLKAYLNQAREQFGNADPRVRNAAALLDTAQALVAETSLSLTPSDVQDLRARGIIP